MFKKVFKKYRFYLSIFALSFILGTIGLVLNEKEANKGAESVPQSLSGEAITNYDYLPEPISKPRDPVWDSFEDGIVLSAEENAVSSPDEDYEAEEPSAPPAFIFPVGCNIARDYSGDKLIYFKDMADWRTHPAIDYTANEGEMVLAVADGVVENVYKDPLYGTTVVISHAQGFKSVYASLLENQTVNVGEKLSSGDVVGLVSDSALAEAEIGVHLHFALIKDDAYVNPSDYLK